MRSAGDKSAILALPITTEVRSIFALACLQAIFLASGVIVLSLSGLVGATLATHPALATVPFAILHLTTALTTGLVSLAMARWGRAPIFLAGGTFGLLSGLLLFFSVEQESFGLFCLGSVLYGVFQATAFYYRFAAGELASEKVRGRVVSIVVLAGLVGVLAADPLLILINGWGPQTVGTSFLGVAACGAATLFLAAGTIRRRSEIPTKKSKVDSNKARRRQHNFYILSGIGAYAAMVVVMTAAPLSIVGCGFGRSNAVDVIQWHLIGMYAPSILSGYFVDRIGPRLVIAVGLICIAASLAVSLSGLSLAHFYLTLTMIGVGWNFVFVAASCGLSSIRNTSERAEIQALNETAIFATIFISSLSAGLLYDVGGWTFVNLMSGFVLISLVCTCLWQFRLNQLS